MLHILLLHDRKYIHVQYIRQIAKKRNRGITVTFGRIFQSLSSRLPQRGGKRGYLTFSVQDRFFFHRMNTKSSIFTSGGAMNKNTTFGVHE